MYEDPCAARRIEKDDGGEYCDYVGSLHTVCVQHGDCYGMRRDADTIVHLTELSSIVDEALALLADTGAREMWRRPAVALNSTKGEPNKELCPSGVKSERCTHFCEYT